MERGEVWRGPLAPETLVASVSVYGGGASARSAGRVQLLVVLPARGATPSSARRAARPLSAAESCAVGGVVSRVLCRSCRVRTVGRAAPVVSGVGRATPVGSVGPCTGVAAVHQRRGLTRRCSRPA
jgi:hypothetical protein